ncbi:substrate-binding periplasmic protein [Roseateles albus]
MLVHSAFEKKQFMPGRRNMLLALAAGSFGAKPSILAAETPAKQQQALIFLTTEYPPYMSESLVEGGPAVAITRAALARAGFAMSVDYRPWARVLAEAQRGLCDGIVGSWLDPKREAYLAYSEPLGIANRIGFMARAGSSLEVSDLGKLTTLHIGTVRGYVNPPAFELAHLQRDEALNDLGNLRKLLAGRIDLALIDKGVAFRLLKTTLRSAAKQLVWLEPALTEMPLHAALTRTSTDFSSRLALFNKSLAEMKASGELAAVIKQTADWL